MRKGVTNMAFQYEYRDNEPFMNIPNHIIRDKENDDKYILVAIYLICNMSLLGLCHTSISILARKLGYKPDPHVGRINDVIKRSLSKLEENGHVCFDRDLEKTKVNDCFEISINPNSSLFYPENYFTQITWSVFEKIIKSKNANDRGRLVRLFLVLKSYLNTNIDGLPFVFPSIRTISKVLGVSQGANICKSIEYLRNESVIYTYCAGGYYDNNGNFKNMNTYYAFEPDQFGQAEDFARAYLKYKGIDIVNFLPKTKN
jgi:hypothetical protein